MRSFVSSVWMSTHQRGENPPLEDRNLSANPHPHGACPSQCTARPLSCMAAGPGTHGNQLLSLRIVIKPQITPVPFLSPKFCIPHWTSQLLQPESIWSNLFQITENLTQNSLCRKGVHQLLWSPSFCTLLFVGFISLHLTTGSMETVGSSRVMWS